MSVNPTRRMPGYQECAGDAVDQMAPQFLEHDGKTFLVVHASAFSSGVMRPTGTNGEADRIVMTIWADAAPGAPVSMALSFTPDDDMLDVIISSLTVARDRQREFAKTQAAAALRKAAGK